MGTWREISCALLIAKKSVYNIVALVPLFLGLLDACTGGGWLLLFVALLEVVLVSWIYGVDKIFAHIEEMEIKIPTFMKCYWRVCWKYLTPGNPIHITKLYIHLTTSHQRGRNALQFQKIC